MENGFYHKFVKNALRPVIVHVEAGLRSYNRRMPEEINRVVSDELSDILLCPTEVAVENLRKEGIRNRKDNSNLSLRIVDNTGDVMYDTALYYSGIAQKKSDILKRLNLLNKTDCISPYVLFTIHRAENTDDRERLTDILKALNCLSSKGVKIVLPLHPRTQKIIRQHDIQGSI